MTSRNWSAQDLTEMREDFEKKFPDAANGFKNLVKPVSKRKSELESVCKQAKKFNVAFDKLADIIYRAIKIQEEGKDLRSIAAWVNSRVTMAAESVSDSKLPISSSTSSNGLVLNLRIPVDLFVKIQSFADSHKMNREDYAVMALTSYVGSSQGSVDNNFEGK